MELNLASLAKSKANPHRPNDPFADLVFDRWRCGTCAANRFYVFSAASRERGQDPRELLDSVDADTDPFGARDVRGNARPPLDLSGVARTGYDQGRSFLADSRELRTFRCLVPRRATKLRWSSVFILAIACGLDVGPGGRAAGIWPLAGEPEGPRRTADNESVTAAAGCLGMADQLRVVVPSSSNWTCFVQRDSCCWLLRHRFPLPQNSYGDRRRIGPRAARGRAPHGRGARSPHGRVHGVPASPTGGPPRQRNCLSAMEKCLRPQRPADSGRTIRRHE